MASSAAVAAAIALGIISVHGTRRASGAAAASAPPTDEVSNPLQRSLDTQLKFLGQYSAVDRVELRAQVGGTLSEIHFKDGDIVFRFLVCGEGGYQVVAHLDGGVELKGRGGYVESGYRATEVLRANSVESSVDSRPY